MADLKSPNDSDDVLIALKRLRIAEPAVDAAAPVAERLQARPEPPAVDTSAEARSRLNWFIGVSDTTSQDPGSLTYEPFYGLREKPFSLSADPRFFFSRSSHGAAFDTLAAGIRRREGVLVLTGEVGTGKTTLCRAVLQSLDQKTFAAFVPDPFLSREDLLKTLLVDFGVVSMEDVRNGRLRGASRADLSYPLYEFLTSLQPLKAFAVVMIDEAQNLRAELLEEIRVLSDLESGGQRLLEVVLVGQPELQSRLAANEMRQLSQRVAIRCDLSPLRREETKPYIMHRLAVAGSDGRVQFADAAIDGICAASNGIPRVINLVCDRALLQTSRARKTHVEAEHVAAGIAELKLPLRRAETTHLASKTTLQAAAGSQSGDPFSMFLKEFRPESELRARDTAPPAAGEPAPETSVAPSGRLVRKTKLPPFASDLDRSDADTFWKGGADEAASKPDPVPAASEAKSRAGRWLGAAVAVLAIVAAFGGYRFSGMPLRTLAAGLVGYWYTGTPMRPVQTPRQTPAPVQARVNPPVPAPAPAPADVKLETPVAPPAVEAPARFAVQMATFQRAARADQAARELSDAGFRAYSAEQTLRDGSNAFAVLLGPYSERDEAEQDRDLAQDVPGYGTGRIIQLATPQK